MRRPRPTSGSHWDSSAWARRTAATSATSWARRTSRSSPSATWTPRAASTPRRRSEDRYGDQVKSGEYKGCAAYNDFRELLARKDIDAVVIATPDHWHAIPVHRGLQGGQGHLLREAADADHPRGQGADRRRAQVRPRLPDRQPAALRARSSAGLRAGPQRPHRQGQDGQRRRRRPEQAVRPARREDGAGPGLGPLARPGAAAGPTTRS